MNQKMVIFAFNCLLVKMNGLSKIWRITTDRTGKTNTKKFSCVILMMLHLIYDDVPIMLRKWIVILALLLWSTMQRLIFCLWSAWKKNNWWLFMCHF